MQFYWYFADTTFWCWWLVLRVRVSVRRKAVWQRNNGPYQNCLLVTLYSVFRLFFSVCHRFHSSREATPQAAFTSRVNPRIPRLNCTFCRRGTDGRMWLPPIRSSDHVCETLTYTYWSHHRLFAIKKVNKRTSWFWLHGNKSWLTSPVIAELGFVMKLLLILTLLIWPLVDMCNKRRMTKTQLNAEDVSRSQTATPCACAVVAKNCSAGSPPAIDQSLYNPWVAPKEVSPACAWCRTFFTFLLGSEYSFIVCWSLFEYDCIKNVSSSSYTWLLRGEKSPFCFTHNSR